METSPKESRGTQNTGRLSLLWGGGAAIACMGVASVWLQVTQLYQTIMSPSPVRVTLSSKDLRDFADKGNILMVLDLLKQQLQREYRELGAKGKNPESHPEAYEEIKKRYLTILGELFGEENAQKHFDKLLTPEGECDGQQPQEELPPEGGQETSKLIPV